MLARLITGRPRRLAAWRGMSSFRIVDGQTDDNRPIPSYLGEPSRGEVPAPPVNTTEQILPFHELDWEDFERLCYRLARLDREPQHVQLFGTRGQDQSGIDIYSRLEDQSYVTYQCKRYAVLTADTIKASVERFLQGEWATKSSRFVLCTSASTVRTDVAEAVETVAAELADLRIVFEVWDAEQLSVSLKTLPELVLEFFGRPWLDRFLATPRQSGSLTATVVQHGISALADEAATSVAEIGSDEGDAGLRTSRIVTVDAAPWRALGVAPTILLTHDVSALPAFLPRTVFENLIERVNDALTTQGPTVIVLQGQPAAGKTRLALEAIRMVCPRAWLIAPASATDARRLFHPRAHPATRLDHETPVVLWLDDLEVFTYPPGFGLTTAHLDELRVETRPVIVMCTVGGKGVNTNPDAADDRALADIVALGGQPITVERRLDSSELRTFSATFGVALPDSVRTAGLGPYLVGVSRITDAWRNGRHAGLRDAPADTVAEGLCLLDGLLALGAEGGFRKFSFDDDDLEWVWTTFRGPDRGVHGPPSPDALARAIRWCTTEVSVGHPLLGFDRRQQEWHLSEILVEYVRGECLNNWDLVEVHERSANLIEDEAARRYDLDRGKDIDRPPHDLDAARSWLDLERWGMIARRLGRLDIELLIYEQAVASGPCLTRVKLALALLSIDDHDGVAQLDLAARHGDRLAEAIFLLGSPAGTDLLKKCVQTPSLSLAGRLTDLLELAYDRRLAHIVTTVLDEVVASGEGPVLSAIGRSMMRQRLGATRFDDLYSSILERADGLRCGDLGATMLDVLEFDRAEPLLRRAAKATPRRLFDLGELLSLSQDHTYEAVAILRRSADETGDPRALQSLAVVLATRLNLTQEAETIYRNAVAVEHVWAFDRLADHLSAHHCGAADEIDALRDRAAELRRVGHPYHYHVPLCVQHALAG
jgi:tetratricopeptide (TPR) repeat protein